MIWTSVRDKMPESSDDVLAFCPELGVHVLYFSSGEWWRAMDGTWSPKVTHWMPLPDEPTEEN